MPINRQVTETTQAVFKQNIDTPYAPGLLDEQGVGSINFFSFTPSIYSGLKSATTTVAGQSENIATGATKLRVINTDATYSAYFLLGDSTTGAEANASTGTAGINKYLILPGGIADIPAGDYTSYAWLGIGGTAPLRVTQGV